MNVRIAGLVIGVCAAVVGSIVSVAHAGLTIGDGKQPGEKLPISVCTVPGSFDAAGNKILPSGCTDMSVTYDDDLRLLSDDRSVEYVEVCAETPPSAGGLSLEVRNCWYETTPASVDGADPNATVDRGLIPCDGGAGGACQACHLVQLGNNVLGWLASVMGIIAVIVVMLAGAWLVVSAGNVAAKDRARKAIATVVVGYILVLGGAFLIDTLMKMFLTNAAYGIWNEVQCVE